MRPYAFFQKYETRCGLVFCLCLSAAIKITLLVLFDKPINADGVLYISAARHFAAGEFGLGMDLYPMPLYSMLIALMHFALHDWETSARLVSLLSMVSSIVPIYLLTRDLFNLKAAFWAALAFAISPMFNEWALDIIRGPVFVFFALWAVWFAQKALAFQKPAFFFWTAVISIFCLFFRVEAVFIIVFFCLFLICHILFKNPKSGSLAKGLIIWLITMVIIGTTCLTAAHINNLQINRFDLLREKAEGVIHFDFMDNYLTLYDELKTLEKQPPFSQESHNLLENTRYFMYLVYLTGLARTFVKVMFPCFFVVLFFSSWQNMDIRHAFVLGLAGFYVFMVYLSLIERDFMQQRFLFAPVCLIYPWVGQGLENLFKRLQNSFHPKAWLIVFLLFFIAAPGIRSFHVIDKADDAMLAAGHFAVQNGLLTDARVLTNDDRLPFYAGLDIYEYETMPNKYSYDFKAIQRHAKKNRSDIIYIKVPKRKISQLNQITDYYEIKNFSGRRRNVYIYGSADFCKNRALRDDKIPPCNPGP